MAERAGKVRERNLVLRWDDRITDDNHPAAILERVDERIIDVDFRQTARARGTRC